MRNDVAVAYLRDQVEVLTGVRPALDVDGDLTIEVDGAQLRLRVRGERSAAVRITAVVADNLVSMPAVQRWVNETNGRIAFARLWCEQRTLLVGSELWADDFTPALIARTLRHLAQEARRASAELSSVAGPTAPAHLVRQRTTSASA